MLGSGDLKANLRRADQRRKLRAYGLIAPLFLFLLAFFLIPIGAVLYFSISNPEVATMLPRVNQALENWDGKEIPDEATFAALAEDLKLGYAN